MEPNYPNYTDDELLQALCAVNRIKFPQRVVLIQQELASRGITYQEQQLPSGERQMVDVQYPRHSQKQAKPQQDETLESDDRKIRMMLTIFVGVGCIVSLNGESFSMSRKMLHLSFPIILLLAMPIGYACWWHWRKSQLIHNSWFWGHLKTTDKFISNAMLLSLIGAVMLLQLGVLAFHYQTRQPSVQMAEIVSIYNKARTGRRGPCSYSMQVKLSGYGLFEWCNQPADLLRQIQVGDPIQLKGKMSAAGFYVDNFQLQPSPSLH